MADYIFDIAADTANQRVNPSIMAQQLEDAAYPSGGAFQGVITMGGESQSSGVIDASSIPASMTVSWQNALDAADEAAQIALVAAHQGQAFGPIVQRDAAEAVQSTTLNALQVALAATAQPLPAGKYLLAVYCETRMSAVVANSGVEAQVDYDRGAGFVNVAEDNWGEAQWHAFSAAGIVTLQSGDTPTLRVRYRRIGALNTAEIQRVRMSIAQQSD